MNMTQPTKLQFSTTGDGTFWASFVGKVKTTQSMQASEVVKNGKKRWMSRLRMLAVYGTSLRI